MGVIVFIILETFLVMNFMLNDVIEWADWLEVLIRFIVVNSWFFGR